VKVAFVPAVREMAAGCVTMAGAVAGAAGAFGPSHTTLIEYDGKLRVNAPAVSVAVDEVISEQPVVPACAALSLSLP
jgi:hypothetical protein